MTAAGGADPRAVDPTLTFLAAERDRLATALAAAEARAAALAEDLRTAEGSLLDATASLAGAVSAYEKYVGRYARRGARDPLFATRYDDMRAAVERAQAACVSTIAIDGGQHG